MISKKQMLALVVNEFNDSKYPFSAEVIDDKLLFKWRWKDATIFGLQSVSREIQEFCYVVIANDNGTFYGYDTENSKFLRGDSNLTISGGSSSFVGHAFHFHKEIVIGKSKDSDKVGVKTFSFSTSQVHKPVQKLFKDNGWKYKEPLVTWVPAPSPETYTTIGVLFTLITMGGWWIFSQYGIMLMLAVLIPFSIIGPYSFLVGIGAAKLPIFSKKFGLQLVFGSFFLLWAVVPLVAEWFLKTIMPTEVKINAPFWVFHLIGIISTICFILTFIIIEIVDRKLHS